MKSVLTFWLAKGAAGFRVDAINHMFEVADLRDEPLNEDDTDPLSYGYTHKDYTRDLVREIYLIYFLQILTNINYYLYRMKLMILSMIGENF